MKALLKKYCLSMLPLLFALFAFQQHAAAQLELPRVSQKASVSQRIGLTDVTITYSRPGVKGRTVWGALVPYEQVWRTGADEATTISISDDVMINGQKLPAGAYSIHAIPSKDEWTLIFNKVAKQWGSFQYDQAKDALRVKVKPQATPEHQEWLSFSFPVVTPTSAQVVLQWEKLKVPFTIETEVMAKALMNSRAAVAAAKADDWRTPLQAATFSFQNNVNLDEAMKWVDQSINIKSNYNNLGLKARMLAKAGKVQEAISYAEKAVQSGKTSEPKVDTSALEKELAEWKARRT